jgi:Na+/melibiose symporter-like transporter
MMLIYVGPPTIISLGIALVMWRFPLNEEKQRELRRIIEARAAAQSNSGSDKVAEASPSPRGSPGDGIPGTGMPAAAD